jgi:hypothetical protein
MHSAADWTALALALLAVVLKSAQQMRQVQHNHALQ